MKINRRQFLKTLAAGTFIVSTGIGIDDIIPYRTKLHNAMDWQFDLTNRVIKYIGPEDKTWTMRELYSLIQNILDDPHLIDQPNIISAATPEIFYFQNDWTIRDKAVEHLCGGSLQDQHGNTWCNFATVGTFLEGETNFGLIREGELAVFSEKINNHVDTVVKTKDNGSLLCDELIFRTRGFNQLPYEYTLHEDWGHPGKWIIPIHAVEDIPYSSTTIVKSYDHVQKIKSQPNLYNNKKPWENIDEKSILKLKRRLDV